MDEPDYIVIRLSPDLPPGTLPKGYDGRWFDRSQMPQPADPEAGRNAVIRYGGGVAVATGRFEIREHDGAIAEVYEVRR